MASACSTLLYLLPADMRPNRRGFPQIAYVICFSFFDVFYFIFDFRRAFVFPSPIFCLPLVFSFFSSSKGSPSWGFVVLLVLSSRVLHRSSCCLNLSFAKRSRCGFPSARVSDVVWILFFGREQCGSLSDCAVPSDHVNPGSHFLTVLLLHNLIRRGIPLRANTSAADPAPV